ncbi:MAG TPA: flagellar protein FlgN [Steroidobacteraceae bacterium]|nr:flagellar protein FlgN [Steroidobacteraceae bacterium]
MGIQPEHIRLHLERVLGEESVLLAELEQVLAAEAAVVRGDDPGAIENIGANRHRCVARLTQLDGERASACRMLSFGSGREAFERLLAWCDPAQSLRPRWQSNLACAHRCKELNDRNGAVVMARMGQVQQRLATLRGEVPGPVYARRGGRFEGVAPRILGQA